MDWGVGRGWTGGGEGGLGERVTADRGGALGWQRRPTPFSWLHVAKVHT